MAVSLAPGKCITYQDSKCNYAVVIAIGNSALLVASGTSNSSSSGTSHEIADPVQPRSSPARRWNGPPITQTTYFYDFYIQPIETGVVDIKVHSPCHKDLWDKIRCAAQAKVADFHRRHEPKSPIDGEE